MADLLQDNLALGERLDKHRTRLYNLENLNIPHKVSQAIDEIVFDVVDWAMQAPLRPRFRDLPTKSLELDYSNQRLADQEEAHKKRRERRGAPRSPLGLHHHSHLIHLLQQAHLVLQGCEAPSSSKTTTLAQQSMAWTTSDTRYESTGIVGAQELSPLDDLMHDDSAPDEQ
ncbi:hypothetical protein Tco_0034943, partial [Tanacetum coccineum]